MDSQVRNAKDWGDFQYKLGMADSLRKLVEILSSLNYQTQEKEQEDDKSGLGNPGNDAGGKQGERPAQFFATVGESYTGDLDKPAEGPAY